MKDNSPKKGLHETAYRPLSDGEEYVPYVPSSARIDEFTFKSVFVGIIIGIIFGAANAYLGLKVGMTVSASIPAAVIGVALFRLFKGGTPLETNIVQTIGSAGESLAAGVIFTIPALIIWGVEPDQLKIFVLATLGGLLGVLFMIPLRRYLIVKEHGKLIYPEGTACAEIIVAGDSGGSRARLLFKGLGIGFIYQILSNQKFFGLWKTEAVLKLFSRGRDGRMSGIGGAEIGIDLTPELLGVGYIIGPKIAAVMLSGGMLAWLVIIPLIYVYGANSSTPLYPETVKLISQMEPSEIWNRYIRYIGAGAVAFGGIMTLIKALPIIFESFRLGISGMKEGSDSKKTNDMRINRDIPIKYVILGIILIIFFIFISPESIVPTSFLGAIMIVISSFFFVTVSSRIVGLIGSSSNPVSGMTIATLLLTALLFVITGNATSPDAKIEVLTVGSIVCIAAAIAGDTSQDLKTGYLVGATPSFQQIGEMIGVLTSAVVIGSVLIVLHKGLGIGSEHLPAPQATLMALVIKGVIDGNLPWTLVFIGVIIAMIFELLELPSLAMAVGLYLPLSLSTPIMVGGLARWWIEKRGKQKDKNISETREKGILYCSGLIAGAALSGVLIAFMVFLSDKVFFINRFMHSIQSLTEGFGQLESFIIFLALAVSILYFTRDTKDAKKA